MLRRRNLGGVYARSGGERGTLVRSEYELRNALKDTSVDRILLDADFEITYRLVVSRAVRVNGQGHTITVDTDRVSTLWTVREDVGLWETATRLNNEPFVLLDTTFKTKKGTTADPLLTTFMDAHQNSGVLVAGCQIYATTALSTTGTDTTQPDDKYGIYFENNIIRGNVDSSAGAVRGAFSDNRFPTQPTISEYSKFTGFLWDTNINTVHVYDNLETPPISQRFYQRLHTPDDNVGGIDIAALYGDANHADGYQRWNMVFEIGSGQADATAGGSIKFVHFGSGDAVYGVLHGSGGALFEAASFHPETKGVISTNQYIQSVGSLGDYDAALFVNNTHFGSAWGWDGTGGSVVKSNFATYWADRSLGHAFGVRVQDRTETVTADMTANGVTNAGVVDDTVEFRIFEFTGRHIWTVSNTGNQMMSNRYADASTTLRDSPYLQLRGAYWDGAASQDKTSQMDMVVNSATSGTFRLAVNASYALQITADTAGTFTYNFGNYALTNIDWGASDSPMHSFGPTSTEDDSAVTFNGTGGTSIQEAAIKIGSGSVGTGTRTLSGDALLSGGYITTGGTIEATTVGAVSLGWVREDSGTAKLSATGSGSTALGAVWTITGTGTLEATADGAFAHGFVAQLVAGTGGVDNDQTGAFAGGYAVAGGTIEALTGGGGSFAHGCSSGGLIRATGVWGAFANGYAGSSNIIASADGAIAQGAATAGNAITASGSGSGAFGASASGAITASASNAFQFGVGVNAEADSLQVGSDMRLVDGGAPGTPKNGDVWLATNDVTIRTAGVNLVLNRPTVSGSTGGNAALQNLCAALATMNLIVDSTT